MKIQLASTEEELTEEEDAHAVDFASLIDSKKEVKDKSAEVAEANQVIEVRDRTVATQQATIVSLRWFQAQYVFFAQK